MKSQLFERGRAMWVVAVMAALAWTALPAMAGPGPSTATMRVDAVVEAGGVRIEAKSSDSFEFTTYRPNDTLFVVDFAGVTAPSSSVARVLKSDVVSSYRVLQYRAGDRSIVRLEVLLRAAVEPRIERTALNHVVLHFGGTSPAAAAAKPEPVAAKVAPAPATKSAAIRPGDAIRKVEVSEVANQAQVRVVGNGRLEYEATRLSNPERLVLDFEGARLLTRTRSVPSSHAPVKSVRLGQFKPEVARVVIDLDRGVSYSVSNDAEGLTVSFSNTIAAAQQPTRYQVPSEGTAQPVTVEMVPAKAEPAPAEVEPPAAQPETKLPEPKPEPKVEGKKVNEVAPPPAEVKSEEAIQAPVVLASPRKADASSENMAPAETPAAAPSQPMVAPMKPAATSPQGSKYSGEPISVNFKDVDLKDFFRLVHEISGLNVVVDQNVRGQLTLVMDDVPWDQVLDIVLMNYSLDKQIEGNVLRVATRDTLRREAEMKRDLAKAQAEAVDQVTTTRVLSYAKAVSMRDTLRRFLSSRGEILADERSNTLIIRDIPSTLPDIDNLIRQLDRKSQQVEIEARVVAATRSFAREIGTQFGFATTSTGGRSVFGGLVGASGFTSPIATGAGLPAPPLVTSGTTSLPFNSNLGAAAPNSGATFAHRSPNFALDFIISAAESRGVGKLLSKPRVITQNNEKAVVKQGTKIPVQTVINNTISVQFIDAVLQLDVTPQITAEGTIFMTVKIENTAIDPGIARVNNIPALSTQEATSSVTIPDGGTMVIGGVHISSQRTDVSQVPLVGSIPIIGHLFKRTSVSTSSQELLFFVTPRIIPN